MSRKSQNVQALLKGVKPPSKKPPKAKAPSPSGYRNTAAKAQAQAAKAASKSAASQKKQAEVLSKFKAKDYGKTKKQIKRISKGKPAVAGVTKKQERRQQRRTRNAILFQGTGQPKTPEERKLYNKGKRVRSVFEPKRDFTFDSRTARALRKQPVTVTRKSQLYALEADLDKTKAALRRMRKRGKTDTPQYKATRAASVQTQKEIARLRTTQAGVQIQRAEHEKQQLQQRIGKRLTAGVKASSRDQRQLQKKRRDIQVLRNIKRVEERRLAESQIKYKGVREGEKRRAIAKQAIIGIAQQTDARETGRNLQALQDAGVDYKIVKAGEFTFAPNENVKTLSGKVLGTSYDPNKLQNGPLVLQVKDPYTEGWKNVAVDRKLVADPNALRDFLLLIAPIPVGKAVLAGKIATSFIRGTKAAKAAAEAGRAAVRAHPGLEAATVAGRTRAAQLAQATRARTAAINAKRAAVARRLADTRGGKLASSGKSAVGGARTAVRKKGQLAAATAVGGKAARESLKSRWDDLDKLAVHARKGNINAKTYDNALTAVQQAGHAGNDARDYLATRARLLAAGERGAGTSARRLEAATLSERRIERIRATGQRAGHTNFDAIAIRERAVASTSREIADLTKGLARPYTFAERQALRIGKTRKGIVGGSWTAAKTVAKSPIGTYVVGSTAVGMARNPQEQIDALGGFFSEAGSIAGDIISDPVGTAEFTGNLPVNAYNIAEGMARLLYRAATDRTFFNKSLTGGMEVASGLVILPFYLTHEALTKGAAQVIQDMYEMGKEDIVARWEPVLNRDWEAMMDVADERGGATWYALDIWPAMAAGSYASKGLLRGVARLTGQSSVDTRLGGFLYKPRKPLALSEGTGRDAVLHREVSNRLFKSVRQRVTDSMRSKKTQKMIERFRETGDVAGLKRLIPNDGFYESVAPLWDGKRPSGKSIPIVTGAYGTNRALRKAADRQMGRLEMDFQFYLKDVVNPARRLIAGRSFRDYRTGRHIKSLSTKMARNQSRVFPYITTLIGHPTRSRKYVSTRIGPGMVKEIERRGDGVQERLYRYIEDEQFTEAGNLAADYLEMHRQFIEENIRHFPEDIRKALSESKTELDILPEIIDGLRSKPENYFDKDFPTRIDNWGHLIAKAEEMDPALKAEVAESAKHFAQLEFMRKRERRILDAIDDAHNTMQQFAFDAFAKQYPHIGYRRTSPHETLLEGIRGSQTDAMIEDYMALNKLYRMGKAGEGYMSNITRMVTDPNVDLAQRFASMYDDLNLREPLYKEGGAYRLAQVQGSALEGLAFPGKSRPASTFPLVDYTHSSKVYDALAEGNIAYMGDRAKNPYLKMLRDNSVSGIGPDQIRVLTSIGTDQGIERGLAYGLIRHSSARVEETILDLAATYDEHIGLKKLDGSVVSLQDAIDTGRFSDFSIDSFDFSNAPKTRKTLIEAEKEIRKLTQEAFSEMGMTKPTDKIILYRGRSASEEVDQYYPQSWSLTPQTTFQNQQIPIVAYEFERRDLRAYPNVLGENRSWASELEVHARSVDGRRLTLADQMLHPLGKPNENRQYLSAEHLMNNSDDLLAKGITEIRALENVEPDHILGIDRRFDTSRGGLDPYSVFGEPRDLPTSGDPIADEFFGRPPFQMMDAGYAVGDDIVRMEHPVIGEEYLVKLKDSGNKSLASYLRGGELHRWAERTGAGWGEFPFQAEEIATAIRKSDGKKLVIIDNAGNSLQYIEQKYNRIRAALKKGGPLEYARVNFPRLRVRHWRSEEQLSPTTSEVLHNAKEMFSIREDHLVQILQLDKHLDAIDSLTTAQRGFHAAMDEMAQFGYHPLGSNRWTDHVANVDATRINAEAAKLGMGRPIYSKTAAMSGLSPRVKRMVRSEEMTGLTKRQRTALPPDELPSNSMIIERLGLRSLDPDIQIGELMQKGYRWRQFERVNVLIEQHGTDGKNMVRFLRDAGKDVPRKAKGKGKGYLQDLINATGGNSEDYVYLNMDALDDLMKNVDASDVGPYTSAAKRGRDIMLDRVAERDKFYSLVEEAMKTDKSGRWVAISKEAFRPVLKEFNFLDKSRAFRTLWDMPKALASRLLLAPNISWLQFQIYANAVLSGVAGTGPRAWIQAQERYKKLSKEGQHSVDLALGVQTHHLDISKMNHDLFNYMDQWTHHSYAYRRHLEGRNFLDAFFWVDGKNNRFFRKAVLYNGMKRAAYKRMGLSANKITRLIQKGLDKKKRGQSLDQAFEDITKDSKLMDNLAKEMESFLGDYLNFSPVERGVMQRSVMFYGFLRHSIQFSLHTLPIEHPMRLGLIQMLSKMAVNDAVSMFGSDDLDRRQLGKFYIKGPLDFPIFGRIDPNPATGLLEIDLSRASVVGNLLFDSIIAKGPGLKLLGASNPFYAPFFEAEFGTRTYTGTPLRYEQNPSFDWNRANASTYLTASGGSIALGGKGRYVTQRLLETFFRPYRIATQATSTLPFWRKSDDSMLLSERPYIYAPGGEAAGQAAKDKQLFQAEQKANAFSGIPVLGNTAVAREVGPLLPSPSDDALMLQALEKTRRTAASQTSTFEKRKGRYQARKGGNAALESARRVKKRQKARSNANSLYSGGAAARLP